MRTHAHIFIPLVNVFYMNSYIETYSVVFGDGPFVCVVNEALDTIYLCSLVLHIFHVNLISARILSLSLS